VESGILRSANVAKPESGSGEVVIAVSAYGVCQSNLPIIAGAWVANGGARFPVAHSRARRLRCPVEAGSAKRCCSAAVCWTNWDSGHSGDAEPCPCCSGFGPGNGGFHRCEQEEFRGLAVSKDRLGTGEGNMMEMNRRVKLLSPGRLAIFEESRPIPGPGEYLIKVSSVGVCGSDVHYFEHGRITKFVVKAPLVLGHESSGVIVGSGPGADPNRVGVGLP